MYQIIRKLNNKTEISDSIGNEALVPMAEKHNKCVQASAQFILSVYAKLDWQSDSQLQPKFFAV